MKRSNRHKPPECAVCHLGKVKQVRYKPPLLLLSILLITEDVGIHVSRDKDSYVGLMDGLF